VDYKAVDIASEVQAWQLCLPAHLFADFKADNIYDAVILCSALIYADGQTQDATVGWIVGYNADLPPVNTTL